MDIASFSPYLRFAHESRMPAPFILEERIIFDYEIIYLQESTLKGSIDKEPFCIEPGHVLILRPNVPHQLSFYSETEIAQPHIHFDLFEDDQSRNIPVNMKPLYRMSMEERQKCRKDCLVGDLYLPPIMKLQHPVEFEKLLFSVIREFTLKMPFYEMNVKGGILEILTFLYREYHWINSTGPSVNIDLLTRIKMYLSNKADTTVTLDELSNEFHISKYHLIRLFQNVFGISPIKYHLECKLNHAKTLLATTNFTITQISQSCGFNSIHAFSRAFKTVEGISPREYRYQ